MRVTRVIAIPLRHQKPIYFDIHVRSMKTTRSVLYETKELNMHVSAGHKGCPCLYLRNSPAISRSCVIESLSRNSYRTVHPQLLLKLCTLEMLNYSGHGPL